jgi:hypothetical protein
MDSGRLFITDKASKRRFLIDTGSDLCVFPRLRWDFTWRFVVADVTQPLIGADFLSHFGLLVDCRNNRLLDGVTSLSAPAQAAGFWEKD